MPGGLLAMSKFASDDGASVLSDILRIVSGECKAEDMLRIESYQGKANGKEDSLDNDRPIAGRGGLLDLFMTNIYPAPHNNQACERYFSIANVLSVATPQRNSALMCLYAAMSDLKTELARTSGRSVRDVFSNRKLKPEETVVTLLDFKNSFMKVIQM